MEIPEWLALDRTLVDKVHTSVYADARLTGYSYVLSQAHQHAVMPFDVAQVLLSASTTSYWAVAGQAHSPSAKEKMKRS